MPATVTVYDSFTYDVLNGDIGEMDSITIKAMILDNSYTPNYTTHTTRNDLTNEVSGTGYSAGGKTLASKTLTLDTTNHLTNFDHDDLTWTEVTFTNGRYLVLYVSNGGAASGDPLILCVDFGTNHNMAGNDFTIQLDSLGILYLQRV